MKNPLKTVLPNNEHVEIGDPFIMRFNGCYYLYCSTCDDVKGIRCFVSEDLVNFKYAGLCAEHPILDHSYAPEVIYHNNEFIMSTSPWGNGHYFLKSKSPLGPFELISDNLHNMIDGSFINDKNNQLHFLRADHNGIAFLDYKNNKLVNRKDIAPQIASAWTEGPSLTYFNNYYYLTFCGNNVICDNYRVHVASSKNMDRDFIVQSQPLLISLKENYSALGHNSVVLGPSLDEYFVAYHKLDWLSETKTTRYLCLDRLYFNKRYCVCNNSNFEIINPKRPDFECFADKNNKLECVDDKLIADFKCENKFTAEFNFEGETTIVLGYKDEQNYSLIHFVDNSIDVVNVINGIKNQIINKKVNFDFSHFHCVRVINDKKCELLLDNIFLFKFKLANVGKCGYLNKEKGLYYTAITNSVYTESMKTLPNIIPGKVQSNYIDNGKFKLKNNEDDIDSIIVKANDFIKFETISNNNGNYKLFARMKNNNCILKISSSLEEIIVELNQNDCEYLYGFRYLGEISLLDKDKISIQVLKGSFEFKYLSFLDKTENNLILEQNKLNDEGEVYLFNKPNNIQSIDFSLLNGSEEKLFGLIVNATNYSKWESNKQLRYMGYFVGFDNDLLVIDYCEYDRIRIYDKPYKLNNNCDYNLKVKIEDNMIYVYINDKLEITTCLKYDQGYGLSGFYKDKYTRIKINKYEG